MSLRSIYFICIGLVHLCCLGLSFTLLQENLIWFLAVEVVVLGSLYVCYRLYQRIIAPLQLLISGTEAIRDRDFNVKFVPTGTQEMDRIVTVYNAMIDQLREERTIQQEQHYFLEKLVQTSPIGIIILTLDGAIEQINPRALQFLKIPGKEVLGKSLTESEHPVLQEIQHLPAGASVTIPYHGVLKCEKSFFMDRGFQRYFLTLEELTAELHAAERHAYGKVIRMMSHEVNNTLGAVNSLLDTTVDWIDESNPTLSSALKIAMTRNDHLGQFTKRFAEVVRLPVPQKTQINLNQIVNDCVQLMEPLAQSRRVRLTIAVNESCILFGDRLQLEQVIINATKNAIEAIAESGEVQFLIQQSPAQLIIRNNGKDLTPEESRQLFTPFYTNKPNGQGIGLTVIREILHSHGFGFSLRTVTPGQTDFTITF